MIELTLRSKMNLNSPSPVIGTYQGVWAGIQVTDAGASKAGPSGSAWIDTNTGFLAQSKPLGGDIKARADWAHITELIGYYEMLKYSCLRFRT